MLLWWTAAVWFQDVLVQNPWNCRDKANGIRLFGDGVNANLGMNVSGTTVSDSDESLRGELSQEQTICESTNGSVTFSMHHIVTFSAGKK